MSADRERGPVPTEVLKTMRAAARAASAQRGTRVPMRFSQLAFAEMREAARGGGVQWDYRMLEDGTVEVQVDADLAAALTAGAEASGRSPSDLIVDMARGR